MSTTRIASSSAIDCFDRLLLNGLIQPFQQPERVLGFFNAYREGKRVTHRTLTEIADQFLYWVKMARLQSPLNLNALSMAPMDRKSLLGWSTRGWNWWC